MKFKIRSLTPSLWEDLERLFGERGACGGCWCMFWRQPLGQKWDQVKGKENKKSFKKLVLAKKVHGAIAYDGEDPVGWINWGPRKEYLKLDRSPSFQCNDAEKVWSIPCFYILPSHRNKKVGSQLLEFSKKKLKNKVLEAYPVQSKSSGKIPGAFAWTGTLSMFLKQGFKPVTKRGGGKVRVRLE